MFILFEKVNRKPQPSWTLRSPIPLALYSLSKKVEVLAALIIGWATVTLTIYTFDVPGLGGSDDFCDSFYIAPDAPENSTYPYSNTFDVHRPIDWSKAGQSDALNYYRAIGTHNSYHLKQYEGSPTYFASWWATLVREWQYDHPTLIQQLNQGTVEYSAQVFHSLFRMAHNGT